MAVPPVAALSSGLVATDYVFVTGQLAYQSEYGGVQPGLDAAGQCRVVMERLTALLASEGLTMGNLVKVTIFVTNIADIAAINDVYASYVSNPVPARSTIGVAFLALPGASVEIEAVARIPDGR